MRKKLVRSCGVAGCDRPYKCGGYCAGHYERFLRHGDPTVGRATRGSLLEWLEETFKAPPTDECILWPFTSNRGGYGCLRVKGRLENAHHLVAIWAHGEPLPRQQAAHSCGDRACVNPRHLRWASPKENASDTVMHGRTQRGQKNPHNRLTTEQAHSVKYASIGVSHAVLAKRLGVDSCTIIDIRKGRTWAWL